MTVDLDEVFIYFFTSPPDDEREALEWFDEGITMRPPKENNRKEP